MVIVLHLDKDDNFDFKHHIVRFSQFKHQSKQDAWLTITLSFPHFYIEHLQFNT